MSKRQANPQNPPPRQHYPPGGPPPGRGTDILSIFTLVGVVAVLTISFANWREMDRIQESLDSRLSQIDTKIAQIQSRPAAPAPAQQARRGPDPNRAYDIKTDGRPSKGPAKAAVTIAEFSDFQ